MLPELERTLASSRTLESRLRAIIQQKFETFAPNRALLGALSAHIDPDHPLSPFSGFHELADAGEQRRRFTQDLAIRRHGGSAAADG